jgi:hypothetical protein
LDFMKILRLWNQSGNLIIFLYPPISTAARREYRTNFFIKGYKTIVKPFDFES